MDKYNSLHDILRNLTSNLKDAYLTKTAEWATNYHDFCTKKYYQDDEAWCNDLGITPILTRRHSTTERLSFPDEYYNSKRYRNEYITLRQKYRLIALTDREKYISKEIKYAERHYESSLDKLTKRILEKDLDITKIKISDESIGININLTISDGIKTIKAWTIVAEGEIQRPHFRYLIK
jgi:hypothetical protein